MEVAHVSALDPEYVTEGCVGRMSMVHDKCTEMGITNTNTTINIRTTYVIGDHDQDNHHITHSSVTIGKH